MKSKTMFRRLLGFLLLVVATPNAVSLAQSRSPGWKSLFNGRDLSGWDTYLRAPNLVGYSDDPSIPYQPPIGLNHDPFKVFTVENGVIHVSGQIWGAITSKEAYRNYHVRFQTKWGEKKWAPKDKSLRDGGFLFHCTDAYDYGFKCWMRSLEMQVQEGEIGDLFNVGAGDAEGQMTKVTTRNAEVSQQYDPAAPLTRYNGRVYRSGDFESPKGQWTTSEVIARHADAVFIVNGFVVNRLYNIFRSDLRQQVTGGKLQFQSEGAEHFYKTIEIRPLSFEHGTPALVSQQKEIRLAAGESQSIEITNRGEAVEIIAAELLGKEIEQFLVKLPPLPMVLKKGGNLTLPVSLRPESKPGNQVKLRLETVLGPVADFEVSLESR
ncbi:MAG: DUF1080 domain-containing protein [Ferruginibacter sp.]|nr:DUF1080 domain-containing protein [Cytophagales bacterium]